MFIVNIIATALVIIGALNWLIIGVCGYNVVSGITGSDDNVAAKIIYILVGASAIWLIISAILSGGIISFITL